MMRKEVGKYIIELYDEYTHKVGEDEAVNHVLGVQKAKEWERRGVGYTAIVSRIQYNTNSTSDKWDYVKKEQDNVDT